jgi:hypothetical protein
VTQVFALSVPTDIPWRRVCASGDMHDADPCDLTVPPRWRSSIALFRYDPADSFQPYSDLHISYLKLTVTLTPFAPELDIKLGVHELDALTPAFPCYGALLHVTVAPPEEQRAGLSHQAYPYFLDVEPKKRELYELVTDTGEVLSGSTSALSVGKSQGALQTTELYNLNHGWNFGMFAEGKGGGGGGGAGFNVGAAGTHGSVSSSGYQSSDIRTADQSTERRELYSHTTQLSQLYNLFQAFHVGTNRALFLMEPRPHVRQSEATFIQGPRALEGIQEVFLVVVRPKAIKELCVGAVLETAHLLKQSVEVFAEDTARVEFRLTAKAPNLDKTVKKDSGEGEAEDTVHYDAPPDFEIVGYDVTLIKTERVIEGPIVDHDKKHLTVRGKVSWRFEEGKLKSGEYEDIYRDGHLHADVRVHLRSTRPTVEEKATRMFLAARQLCCCTKTPSREDITAITYERALPRPFATGFSAASPSRLHESRALTAELRRELERSLSSSARQAFGARSYRTSDTLAAGAAALLGDALDRPAMVANKQLGLSWREVLGDVEELGERLGLTGEAAGRLRRDAIEHALRVARQERRR